MLRLKDRTPEEAYEWHRNTPPRVYETDDAQAERIRRTRAAILRFVPADKFRRVIDLGCGTGDIGGWLASHGVAVWGFESSEHCIRKCRERWPKIQIMAGDIHSAKPMKCDVLIMTEILEHLPAAQEVACAWLPLAEYAVISSPVNENPATDLSAGEHCWGFNEAELCAFMTENGHQVIHQEKFEMGCYIDFLVLSRRAR